MSQLSKLLAGQVLSRLKALEEGGNGKTVVDLGTFECPWTEDWTNTDLGSEIDLGPGAHVILLGTTIVAIDLADASPARFGLNITASSDQGVEKSNAGELDGGSVASELLLTEGAYLDLAFTAYRYIQIAYFWGETGGPGLTATVNLTMTY